MIFDVRTLLIANFLYTLIAAFGLSMTYRDFSGDIRASMRTLFIGLYILSLGWILLSLRGYIPTPISIIFGNLCLLIGEIEIYHAIRVFDGCKTCRKPLAPLVIVAMLLLLYFYYVIDDTNIRVAIISFTSSIISALTGSYMIRKNPVYPSNIRMLTGAAFYALTAVFLIRSVYALFFCEPLESFMQNTPLQILIFGGVLIATFTMVFGYVLMCTHRFNFELKQQAIIDTLSNMYNRRGVENFLFREIEQVKRSKEPLALLIIDANKFKSVNDQFGHAAGDQAIIYIGETLKNSVRSGDLAGRLGGDEFVLVLTNTDYETATSIAERITKTIDDNPMNYEGKSIQLSVCIGVGMLDTENPNYDDLYIRADNALYKEKAKFYEHQTH